MNELVKNLEVRKENLVLLLKDKSDQIEIEKQHQIYGAIKEIDYIVRMLNYNSEQVEMSSEKESEFENLSVIKMINQRIRKFRSPIRIRFKSDES